MLRGQLGTRTEHPKSYFRRMGRRGMRYWAECGCFFSECRQHFQSTGSLLPSSRFLAQTLVTEVRKPRGAARILEVGPGTGSVTRAIARCLQPGDRLDA